MSASVRADHRPRPSSGPPASKPLPRPNGWVPIRTARAACSSTATFAIPDHPTIFAIGDTASAVRTVGADCCPASRRSPSSRAGTSPTSSSDGRGAPFRYRDYGNLATIGRSRAVDRIGPPPAQRFRRLADLVVRPRLVPDRLPQPARGHAQLAVELPHLPAQRAPDHRRDPALRPRRRGPHPSKGNAHEITREGSGRARPDRARPPGRRRARRLPGRGLRSSARGRDCARLGHRHLDRRHQRVADRRQQAGRANRKAVRVLVARSKRPFDPRRLAELDGHARRATCWRSPTAYRPSSAPTRWPS